MATILVSATFVVDDFGWPVLEIHEQGVYQYGIPPRYRTIAELVNQTHARAARVALDAVNAAGVDVAALEAKAGAAPSICDGCGKSILDAQDHGYGCPTPEFQA